LIRSFIKQQPAVMLTRPQPPRSRQGHNLQGQGHIPEGQEHNHVFTAFIPDN